MYTQTKHVYANRTSVEALVKPGRPDICRDCKIDQFTVLRFELYHSVVCKMYRFAAYIIITVKQKYENKMAEFNFTNYINGKV